MDKKIEETIKAIAARHGIAIGRDDPILVLQTINDRLLQDSEIAQQKLLDKFKSELEAIAHRWTEDATSKAERIIKRGLEAAQNEMEKEMNACTKAIAATVQDTFEENASKLTYSVKELQRVAVMNMIAAALTVLAVCILILAVT